MHKLFENTQINGLVLKNRFVMSAALGLKDRDLFKKIAQGQVGLIISGGLEPQEIEPFREIVELVHTHGGKIALQLVPPQGGRFGFDKDAIAVSVLDKDNPFFNQLVPYCTHHEATEEEIETIIDSYVASARLAKQIGADAIEIHSAHQSFLSQFLSPLTNTRCDRWGGSIENRTRIHQVILSSIQAQVGHSFPILIKVGVEDALPNGLKFQEGLEIAMRLEGFGYHALEISVGLQDFTKLFESFDWRGTSMQSNPKHPCYRNWTRIVKEHVSIPVLMVGGIRSYELLEEMANNQEADLFAICRPFIEEPHLISRWMSKNHHPAKCVSCNTCITEVYMKGQPLSCCFCEKKDPKGSSFIHSTENPVS